MLKGNVQAINSVWPVQQSSRGDDRIKETKWEGNDARHPDLATLFCIPWYVYLRWMQKY